MNQPLLEFFFHRGIFLMQETEHAGIRTLRYVPPENAMGAHDDPNPDRRNPDNECFCMAKEVWMSLTFSVFAF